MKRQLAAGLLLLLLTGCAPDVHPGDPPEASTPAGTAAEPDTADSGAADETDAETTDQLPTLEESPAVIPAIPAETTEPPDVYTLYRETLTALHDKQILPSGAKLETTGDIEENRFTVYDIDGDGRDELILSITQAEPRDCFTAVYDIDADGNLRREIRYNAQLSFWSDGIVIARYTDAAENEGDFVPYAVSQYDETQDYYAEFAYVDAVDRDTLAAAGLEDEFPGDADTSGTGRVYLIHGDNPVDVSEYESWYASWHNGLTETELPLLPLTAENLKSACDPSRKPDPEASDAAEDTAASDEPSGETQE